MKISQGDTVQVITGKYKGKKGTVLTVLSGTHRVVVAGINVMTKHIKKTPQSPGRIVKVEASLHASNVALLDPKTGKPTRVGYRKDPKTGRKERYAKKSGATIGRTAREAKKTEKAAVHDDVQSSPTAKKSPFWKRVGFGADAMAEQDGSMKESSAAPAAPAQTHSRSGSRGS